MTYLLTGTLMGMLLVAWLGMKKKQPKACLMGDLNGKHKEHVLAVLGKPNNEVVLVNGTHLLQWYCKSSHISIVFDAEGNFVRLSDNKFNEAV